jgi:hypothetical protein
MIAALPDLWKSASMNVGGSAAPSFIYALGRIEPRFPSLGVEKEFAQVSGRAETARLSDRQAFHQVLTQLENRYLVRQLCWVMTIAGLDTYLLVPRDQGLRPARRRARTRVPRIWIGHRCASIALRDVQRADDPHRRLRPDLSLVATVCAGHHSFGDPEEDFDHFGDVFDRLLMDDNAGATDEHLRSVPGSPLRCLQRATQAFWTLPRSA